ncbi:MAG: hypothetical protein HYY01_09355, partial [Chloroflexi bacterium]|nr:hypothetical protein [Chloroflexota bacterium]
MAVDLLVTGGKLVSPREVFPGAVAIDQGKIVAVGDPDHFPEARRRIDVTGKYVLPGLVDPHIHYHYSERPFGDDARTETRASVAGGVTTQGIYISLEELPWDTYFLPRSLRASQVSAPVKVGPKTMDFEDYKSAFEHNAVADGFFHVQTSKALTQQQADKLLEFGITSFKLYPAKAGLNDADILATFRVIQGLRPPALAMMHCENGGICELLTDEVMKTGRTDHRAYNDARPRFAEVEFMSR